MNRKAGAAGVVLSVVVLAAGIAVIFPGCNRVAIVTQPGDLSQITMIDSAGYPTGMTFSTPDAGFVTCSYSAYTYVLMFKTTDGGLTWKLWSVPLPPAYQNLKPAQDFYADAYPPVFFGDHKNGVIMLDYVQDGKHVMQSYRTADGGGTWTLGPVSDNPDVRTYSFIDATTGWGVDESGKLFTTTDGGATWTAIASTAK